MNTRPGILRGMEIAMWGATIDGLITIAAGLVACYYGFRTQPATASGSGGIKLGASG